MRRTKSARRLAGVAAATLLLSGVLSSCSNDEADEAAERASEAADSVSDAVESAESEVSEALEDVPTDVPTDLSDVPTDLGDVGVGELPDDFPSDIPFPDYEIVSAAGAPAGGWALVLESDLSTDEAFAETEELLLGEGYKADSPAVANAGVYSNKNWTIALAVTDVTGSTTVNYGVTAK